MAEGSQRLNSGIFSRTDELKEILSATTDLGVLYTNLEVTIQSWKETNLNIGVVGQCGAGKTTLIHEILGLETNDDEGVEEKNKLRSFNSEANPNVIFWDLPGVGAKGFEKNSYIDETHLETYDYFLLLSRGRFKEEDVWLAKYALEKKKQFCFVRTHIEEDLENDEDAHPETHDRDKVIGEIRKSCEENLKKAGLKHGEVFLIDSYEGDKHDFPHLYEKLIGDDGGVNACVMAACIAPMTESVINKKADVLRKRIQYVAKVCHSANEREMAKTIFFDECELYRRSFNIDVAFMSELMRDNRHVFRLSRGEISDKLRKVFDITRVSSTVFGAQVLMENFFGEDVATYIYVSSVLLDLLYKLRDIAIDLHVKVLNEAVQKL